MQEMHGEARGTVRKLLTARQVQNMLHIDRSTVYRMAEDGRLPAIKVGRQWRFPADRIAALIQDDGRAAASDATDADSAHPADSARSEHSAWSGEVVVFPRPPGASPGASSDLVDTAFVQAAEAVLAVAGDLLGVMMVVTDMNGRPLTPVANPCDWFADRAEDPEVVGACSAEWQSMADDPDFAPRFRTGVLGFECARAFIRSGTSLIGMVLAGGIAPESSPTPGLYRLEGAERARVLESLPKVAAALSHVPPRQVQEGSPS
jgi:excisionase family DNA binding protein